MNCQARHCVAVSFVRHAPCHRHPLVRHTPYHRHPRFVSRTHLVLSQPRSVAACSSPQPRTSSVPVSVRGCLSVCIADRRNNVPTDSSTCYLFLQIAGGSVLLLRATCRWRSVRNVAGMALRLPEWHCNWWNTAAIGGMALRLVE